MLTLVLTTLIFSAISAFLYRIGGMSKQQAQIDMPWLPQWAVNTKARDIGCALISLIWSMLFIKFPINTPTWKIVTTHTLCFLGTFGALTTYWDDLFGYKDFYVHGFMIGLSRVFFAMFTGCWLMWALHCVFITLWMGLVSKKDWTESTEGEIPDDYGDECSRGAGVIILLPLLLL